MEKVGVDADFRKVTSKEECWIFTQRRWHIIPGTQVGIETLVQWQLISLNDGVTLS